MTTEAELWRELEEKRTRIAQLMSDNSKMAGSMGSMSRYLDDIGIPKVPKINKRVKLMTILYEQMRMENKRLTLLLNDMESDDQ